MEPEHDAFLGGGFKYFCIFTTKIGEEASHFDDRIFFQQGFVKNPPTSFEKQESPPFSKGSIYSFLKWPSLPEHPTELSI